MARKRFTTEQIMGMLREAEVRLSQGQTLGLICKGLRISEQSYDRWRRDYGGLKLWRSSSKSRALWIKRRPCRAGRCPNSSLICGVFSKLVWAIAASAS